MEKNRFCRPSGCFCVPWAHRCHPCNPRIIQGENEKAGGGFRFSVRGLTTLTAQRFGHLSGIQAEGNLTLASQASSLGLFLQWLITGVGALIGIGLIPSEGKVLNILVKKKKNNKKKSVYYFRRNTCSLLKIRLLTLCYKSFWFFYFFTFLFWNLYGVTESCKESAKASCGPSL